MKYFQLALMKTVTSIISVILLITETNTCCVLCARHCIRRTASQPQEVQSWALALSLNSCSPLGNKMSEADMSLMFFNAEETHN